MNKYNRTTAIFELNELPRRINFLLSRKLEIYEFPTISKW
ncbi:MAG: hypothetical protein ACI9L6_001730 [Flavobacterium sp.]|jgi:hypothetical protein